MLYTIGYEGLETGKIKLLQKTLDRLNATLVDVRGIPGFFGAKLAKTLGEKYIWKGNVLGNKGKYQVRPAGIEWVRVTSKTSNIVLMCMELSPADCHRHSKITGPYFGEAIHLIPQLNEVIRADELQRALRDGDDYTCWDYEDVFTAGFTG